MRRDEFGEFDETWDPEFWLTAAPLPVTGTAGAPAPRCREVRSPL